MLYFVYRRTAIALSVGLLSFFILPAQFAWSEESPRTLAQLHQDLEVALCSQDWTEAIGITEKMLESSEITPVDRETLADFREELESYHRSDNGMKSFSWCGIV